MLGTSGRLLRLLGLLQGRRDWAGAELAERLGVSARTIRTDVERLRELGYPVEARPGVAGGYRLGAGGKLPPLLLDDDEAVAVAVGLRTAAGAGVAGIEEACVRALVKLEQVLPSRLRHRIKAMQAATVAVPGSGPTVDPEVLMAIASAIRANERLRFDYPDRAGDGLSGSAGDGSSISPSRQATSSGPPSLRTTEPHRLVTWGRNWYLVAWDNDRADWRTFRVDRITPRTPTGPRFAPRDIPEGDFTDFVRRSVGTASWRYRAQVRVHASADYVRSRLPIPIDPEVVDDSGCVVEFGSDAPHQLALWLGMLDADFEVLDAPELSTALRNLADRYLRAAG